MVGNGELKKKRKKEKIEITIELILAWRHRLISLHLSALIHYQTLVSLFNKQWLCQMRKNKITTKMSKLKNVSIEDQITMGPLPP